MTVPTRVLATAALLALFVLGGGWLVRRDAREAGNTAARAAVEEPSAARAVSPAALDELTGLWARWDAPQDGERTRFWYFHGDGHGLYRYGRVGLVNTHSFDYAIDEEVPGVVRIGYRKTGRAHVLEAVIGTRADGRRTLRLIGDPEDPGAEYVLVAGRVEQTRSELAAVTGRPPRASAPVSTIPPCGSLGAAAAVAPSRDGRGLGDRLWIDWQAHAAGGGSFRMYQLAPTAIDGRGVGWFHEGDFDDWSTEAFDYRVVSTARPTIDERSASGAEIVGELQMQFRLRGEHASTSFVLRDAPKADALEEGSTTADPSTRTLELVDDPRDYWSSHRYLDGGPSFSASRAFDVITCLASLESAPPAG
jgi:hypothetical protein